MQLRKITDDHYVVLSDEPIQEDCYALHISPLGEEEIVTANGECKLDKKITHSTKPLEVWGLDKIYSKIKPIILSECKSLVGEVDVEKKADDFSVGFPISPKAEGGEAYRLGLMDGYWNGYNQCLEDNKDKRFSEEDVRKAYLKGATDCHDKCTERNWRGVELKVNIDALKKVGSTYIQSLTQPKDTWEVEFDENNNLKLK